MERDLHGELLGRYTAMFDSVALVDELYSKYWRWSVKRDCFLDAVYVLVRDRACVVERLTRHMLLDPRSWTQFGRGGQLVGDLVVTD